MVRKVKGGGTRGAAERKTVKRLRKFSASSRSNGPISDQKKRGVLSVFFSVTWASTDAILA